MTTVLCLVVMVGMMAGQSVAGQMRCLSASKDELSAKCILEESRTCDDKVTFHGSSKLIKDIFPSECASVTLDKAEQQLRIDEQEVKDAKTFRDIANDHTANLAGTRLNVAEGPPDVLAIKVPAKSWIVSESVCNESQMCFDGPITCSNHGTLKIGDTVHDSLASCEGGYVYGCADTTRILMHDEQTPPKYYCHKPETK